MSDHLDPDLFAHASIAFDLDGTLVDTAPDLVRALNATITPHGLAPVPVLDVRAMVGRGAQALLERAYASQGRILTPEAAPELVARFIEIYQADIAAAIDEATARPGDRLADRFGRIGIGFAFTET